MGEFEVHRVRFFGLVPAGVRCLACQPRGGRLALGRTDGAVEVYNFAANYFQEKVRWPERALPSRTGQHRAVPGRTSLYLAVPVCSGPHCTVSGHTGPY